jgi:replicative DNA helicase
MSRVTLDPEFPPTAIQAEQILLGKLIRDGANALTEIGTLTPDQFADPLHGALYRAVVQRIEASQPIDPEALAKDSSILDDIGGAGYFQQLTTAARDPLLLGEAADLVRVAWTSRQATTDRAERIPDAHDHRASHAHPIHCTLFAIELDSLASHHESVAADLHRNGSDAADLMEARAAELRRLAVRARAGR